jgi:hypothetical protein
MFFRGEKFWRKFVPPEINGPRTSTVGTKGIYLKYSTKVETKEMSTSD